LAVLAADARTGRSIHAITFENRAIVGSMDAGCEATLERARVGLCVDCARAQRVASSHASVFYLCGMAAVDPAFAKYPSLPVRSCPGYETATVGTSS
jgi:hypothetical protein